jgi:preprotein translocase subunit SecE
MANPSEEGGRMDVDTVIAMVALITLVVILIDKIANKNDKTKEK